MRNENISKKMTMHSKVIISLLVILFFGHINAQYCELYSTCTECMSDSKCKWCSDVETVGQHCSKYEKFYDTEKYEKKYDPEYEEDIYSDDAYINIYLI